MKKVSDLLFSGYVGDPSFLETLARTVTDLRSKNPDIKYVCDPVMGDNGHFYVPEVGFFSAFLLVCFLDFRNNF